MPEFSGSDTIVNLLIFVMSTFLGLELVRHVSRLLHTPLMSLTNASSSVSIIAALIVLARSESTFITVLALVAVALAGSNAIGGFMITERILGLFRRR
ncbi:MAG: proton-translocating transhydrogenase family protein, partial [Chloroflexota bacterium]|nr:proton-translocating transhydrogenase family protein [Chloroflexota bacterium]